MVGSAEAPTLSAKNKGWNGRQTLSPIPARLAHTLQGARRSNGRSSRPLSLRTKFKTGNSNPSYPIFSQNSSSPISSQICIEHRKTGIKLQHQEHFCQSYVRYGWLRHLTFIALSLIQKILLQRNKNDKLPGNIRSK